jgi:hypothetical protein
MRTEMQVDLRVNLRYFCPVLIKIYLYLRILPKVPSVPNFMKIRGAVFLLLQTDGQSGTMKNNR